MRINNFLDRHLDISGNPYLKGYISVDVSNIENNLEEIGILDKGHRLNHILNFELNNKFPLLEANGWNYQMSYYSSVVSTYAFYPEKVSIKK
jgi:hypothetical protein